MDNPYARAFGMVYPMRAPAPGPQQNLGLGGLGQTWGVDPYEEWLRYQARQRGPQTGDLGAYNQPEAPLPVPPAWVAPPPGAGGPPAPSVPPVAPVPQAQPYGPPTPSPAEIQAGKASNVGAWEGAQNWMARNFGGGGGGAEGGAGGGGQGMQALGAMGARMMAPPPAAPEMRLAQPLAITRPQGGRVLQGKPGRMAQRRQGQQQQRRRGILDE